MKKLMITLLVFMLILIVFTKAYSAVIDIDAVCIDPSEKRYIKIKQLLMQIRENPFKEENFGYLEKVISLCNKNSSKAEIYFLMSKIKLYTPLKGNYKSHTDSLDLEGAMNYIDKAMSLDKSKAKYYAQKSEIYSSVRDFYNAIIYYDKAIELDSENSDYFHERAQLYFYIKKYEDAIKNLDVALKLNKKSEYYYTKAFYEKDAGKMQDALNDIEDAIEFGDKELNYYLYIRTRAEIKYELGGFDLNDILKDIDFVIDFEKSNKNNTYWAYTLKGKILEEKKEYEQAVEAYEKAMNLTEYKTYFENKIKFLKEKIK